MKTSEKALALRPESHRVSVQQLHGGSVRRSQVAAAEARKMEAKILFLQPQLEYIQANDEMTRAMGQTAESLLCFISRLGEIKPASA